VKEPSDGAIVRQVLAGDTESFRLLVARHRERLGRFALQMLGNREDAEEALQDAFVRAYRALARCADPDRFDGWLFRILVNRCRTNGARRRRYESTFVGDELVLTATPDPARERTGSDEAPRSEELMKALAQLDADSREAFLLKYVEEWSYEDIAAVTGAGISALKMRVKRACERLRRILMENEHV